MERLTCLHFALVIPHILGAEWVVVDNWKAVPAGDVSTSASAAACEALCSPPACAQWFWNKKSHGCHLSSDTTWSGERSDHGVSGCLASQVVGCPSQKLVPRWTAPLPDKTKSLAGYEPLAGTTRVEVYHGTVEHGTYNHAAMIDFKTDAVGKFLLMWKNCPFSEDCAGQRILYSQSSDGETWTKTDGANIMFPNISSNSAPAALFVGPPLRVNGRQFAAASPGVVLEDGNAAAQGAQFCLWPDPVNARNCGPPKHKQYKSTLMLREVLPDKMGSLGPIFWAEGTSPPPQFAEASIRLGIRMLKEMDASTQSDISKAFSDAKTKGADEALCPPRSDGTLKCEACAGGCQLWDSIAAEGFTNERTHWKLQDGADIIAYRNGLQLWTSARAHGSKEWSQPVQTDIPNDSSNLNAGTLPDGRTFLVHNPLWNWTKNDLGPPPGPPDRPRKPRDPLTLATSSDGLVFDTAGVVMSCTALSKDSRCGPRFGGRAKNPGPSYPQALTVTAPAPTELHGVYVVATNNKEDVWVAKVPYSALSGQPMVQTQQSAVQLV